MDALNLDSVVFLFFITQEPITPDGDLLVIPCGQVCGLQSNLMFLVVLLFKQTYLVNLKVLAEIVDCDTLTTSRNPLLPKRQGPSRQTFHLYSI